MKHRLLFGCLVLTPLLAHADALQAIGEAAAAMFLLALGSVGLTVLLLVLALRRPASRGLQVALGVFLLLFACLVLGGHHDLVLFLGRGLATGLLALVPLALLLNGLTQARQAQQPLACRLWAGVALVGITSLVGLLLPLVPLARVSWYLTTFSVDLFAWALVLGLLRRHQPAATLLWQSWWRTPSVVAGVSASYASFELVLSVVGSPSVGLSLPGLLLHMLLVALPCWVAGVGALRLISPPGISPV